MDKLLRDGRLHLHTTCWWLFPFSNTEIRFSSFLHSPLTPPLFLKKWIDIPQTFSGILRDSLGFSSRWFVDGNYVSRCGHPNWTQWIICNGRKSWGGVRSFHRRGRRGSLHLAGVPRGSTIVVRLLPGQAPQEPQQGMDLGRMRRQHRIRIQVAAHYHHFLLPHLMNPFNLTIYIYIFKYLFDRFVWNIKIES